MAGTGAMLVLALSLGCGSTSGPSVSDGAPDARIADGRTNDAGVGWLSVVELGRGQGIIVEKVTYASGALRIFGQVCRPDDGVRHPLILVNHGGFAGNVDEAFKGDLAGNSFCLAAARLGYVIAESSYRGEDGSDGKVEVCLGEVDDVIAMLGVLRAESYVDAGRIGAFGGSHGGCITMALALREPTLKAAVDFFGPSDLAALDEWWHAQLDQGEPAPYCAPSAGVSWCTPIHQMLIGVIETAIGGRPSAATNAAYRARSPMYDLGKLTVPTAFFQGTADPLVNVDQACKKRTALTAAGHGPAAWYLDPSLRPQTPADVCGGAFRSDPVPDPTSRAAWTANGPFFFIYEGQGHGLTGTAQVHSTNIALQFLFAHL